MATRQKILIGVLIVVAIFFIYSTYFSTAPGPGAPGNSSIGKPPPAQGQRRTAQARAVPPAKKAVPAASSKPMVVFEGNWGERDPFFRKVEKKAEIVVEEYKQELSLILTGVQWVNGKAMAVINNKIYWENDVVDGKKLVKIEKNYVVLRDLNKEYILKIGGKE
ncbi:MAG: hypothetical protein KAR07_09250 [Spirochaetes bacterium]|nr:hypothetical protein [Spirochaetota bacterium]